MKRYCLLLLVVLAMTSCQKSFHAEGFSLLLPNSVVSTKQSPVEDFSLYGFNIRSHLILSAYAGNQPSFPPDQTNGLSGGVETVNTINGCPSRRIVIARDKGLSESHILVHLRTKGWPEYVHFWYTNATPDQTSFAEAIISSVKPE